MPAKRRIAWLVAGLCLLAVVAVLASRGQPVPMHKGKSLAEWFEDREVSNIGLHRGMPGGPNNGPPGAALMAFLEIDADTLPFLARVATTRPSALNTLYARFFSAAPSTVQGWFPQPASAEETRRRQIRALSLIGLLGYWQGQDRPWAPVERNFDPRLLNDTLRTCTSDPDSRVRLTAVEAAGCAWRQTSELIPAIINMMEESPCGGAAINALSCYGEQASNAVPKLVSLLAKNNTAPDQNTVRTIGDIGWPSVQALPQLVKILDSTNEWLQRAAAQAIYQIGTTPEEAAPVLQDLSTTGRLVHVRQCAALALWNMDRENAALVAAVSNAFVESPMLGIYHLRSGKLDGAARTLAPALSTLTNGPYRMAAKVTLEQIER